MSQRLEYTAPDAVTGIAHYYQEQTMTRKATLTKATAAQIRKDAPTPATKTEYIEQLPPAEKVPDVELKKTEATSMDDAPSLNRPALALLDRAVQTAIKNKGQNLDDVNAKIRLGSQSALLEAVQGNLGVACMAIMESPTPDDLKGTTDRRPARVFSLMYGVMRSVIFLANGAYRRWLDPRPNFTLPVADGRDTPEAPWGLQPDHPDEDFEATLYGAVEEIAAFLGALVQVCGYSLDGEDAGTPNNLNGAFPLAYEVRPDQSIEPITDFHRAVDLVEQKRQISLRKRAETERAAYADSVGRALELMAKMQTKPKTTA